MLICDTNSFATGTWFERYLGPGIRSPAVDAIGRRDRAHACLLTEPDIPFVHDSVRDGEHIRDWMHERFASQLDAMTVPTVRLRGSIAQRMDAATAAIDELIASFRVD